MTTKYEAQQRVTIHLTSPVPIEGIKRMLECLPDTVVTRARLITDANAEPQVADAPCGCR